MNNMIINKFLLVLTSTFVLKFSSGSWLSFEKNHVQFADKEDQLKDIRLFRHPLLKSLNNYHVFTPQQYADHHLDVVKRDLHTHHNITGTHFKQSHFLIEYHNRQFVVDLSLNRNLLPKSFSIATFDKDGNRQLHKPQAHELNHCYYQGQVRNIEFSQVVMSTCNGLRGYVSLPDEFFVLEPLNTGIHSDGRHVMYKLSDLNETDVGRKCGNLKHANPVNMVNQLNEFSDSSSSSRRLRRAAPERKFVELVMVADNNEARVYRDRLELDARIKEIVNILDGFYQHLNIRIVLSHVEVWNHTNLLSNSTNAQKLLDEFLNYRLKRRSEERSDKSSPWVNADNFHLLFGGDFDGGTVGMATVATMCGLRSGGVNQDGASSSVLSVASILAHEMGHNFGMGHDTDDCMCTEKADCIMAPSLGYRSTKAWSDCSSAYLDENLRLGVGSCLSNIPDPSTLYGGPECGNEILEQGEECDCGTLQTCSSERQKCCNATTCKLQPTAKCDMGGCCQNCEYRAAAYVCRNAENECGLSEYCTGTSPYCPADVYKLDGTSCSGNSICFDGVCMTHDAQCTSVWGPGATSGPDICYTKINALGNLNGNCGINQNGGFYNCSEENALCGKLVCQGGKDRPVIGRNRYTYKSTVTLNQVAHVCKTIASSASDDDVTDIGLVRTGSKCADGKYCQDGSCISILARALSCDDKCNAHGVCNSRYNCHCNDGWAPPYCSTSGSGGSVNSGPIRGDSADIQTILLIVMIVIVMPLVLAVCTYVWYRYCGGRVQVKTWKKNREKRLALVAISKGKTPKLSGNNSASLDNLVETKTNVTFKTSADKSQKYLVTTAGQSGTKPSSSTSTPRRPPPPSKSPSKIPPPTRPHYAPVATRAPPARKAPPPPTNAGYTPTKPMPTRPPPRPALPPNAWSGDTNEPSSATVKARLQQFNQT